MDLIKIWKSPCEINLVAARDNAFPCLDKCDQHFECPMNSGKLDHLKGLDEAAYDQGYGHGAWVVHTDKLGIAPVCELIFFRVKPTVALMRELYGSHFLHFTEFTLR